MTAAQARQRTSRLTMTSVPFVPAHGIRLAVAVARGLLGFAGASFERLEVELQRLPIRCDVVGGESEGGRSHHHIGLALRVRRRAVGDDASGSA
jgi:hypothetical protein